MKAPNRPTRLCVAAAELLCLFLLALGWAAAGAAEVVPLPPVTLDFPVFWPPRDPATPPPPAARPLLRGSVRAQLEETPATGWVMRITLTLTRSTDEAAREHWNSRLAFPEYDWMKYVRVWDADHRWQWPNLPYLLRLHGKERVDRYGGMDPGKGVDDDFAAIVIRKYAATGTSSAAASRALVSAEWYPVGVTNVDRQTVVHIARSDELTLHLGRTSDRPQGRASLWLIYADWMEGSAPGNWPKEPEYNGGILAYFELTWQPASDGVPVLAIRQAVPPRATGFPWAGWTPRTLATKPSTSTARLSDDGVRPEPPEMRR